jgi:multiple sugar transport system permease protein
VTTRERARRREGAVLMAPALAVLASLTLYPLASVLWLSLERRVPVFGIDHFVGLAHYRFLAGDARFWNAVWVTGVFTVVSVALEVALGLAVAFALRGQRWGQRTAVGLLLLGWTLPAVVTARQFEWLYHPTAGLVNLALGGAAINWLGDPAYALAGVIAADVWRTMPFVALLCYARLLGVPPELAEGAAVDGAGAWATLWWITLPLLRGVVLVAALFRTLDALRAFDLMYVLTGGGPANSTETLTVLAYRSSFQMMQLGFGAAIAVVVLLVVLATAAGYTRALPAPGAAP